MASSLDELQPNDYFQMELEEVLNEYVQRQKVDVTVIFILNQFIEFTCFQKNLDNFQQFKQDLLEEFYSSLLLLLPDQKKEVINQTLKDYFLFINQSGKSVPEFLLNF